MQRQYRPEAATTALQDYGRTIISIIMGLLLLTSTGITSKPFATALVKTRQIPRSGQSGSSRREPADFAVGPLSAIACRTWICAHTPTNRFVVFQDRAAATRTLP